MWSSSQVPHVLGVIGCEHAPIRKAIRGNSLADARKSRRKTRALNLEGPRKVASGQSYIANEVYLGDEIVVYGKMSSTVDAAVGFQGLCQIGLEGLHFPFLFSRDECLNSFVRRGNPNIQVQYCSIK